MITTDKKNSLLYRLNKHRFFYLVGMPGLVLLLLFNYLPMAKLLMAFQNFNPYKGISGSEWVGFAHFIRLFKDPKFYIMLKNTLMISFLQILTFPAPIILAILLNEVKSRAYKRTVQTVLYLPHFLSWVIIASLTFLLLSKEQGVINKIAMTMGNDPKAYLFDKDWAYPIIVLQSLWKNIGWSSIVYMAAISGIDQQLYEAAIIDGANKLRQMLNITLPLIMPTIAVMLILKMGSIINVGFEQMLLISNPMNRPVTEVFELYIYNNGIASGGTQYSYTTAVGMFKSVVSTILVLTSNFIVTRKGFEGVM